MYKHRLADPTRVSKMSYERRLKTVQNYLHELDTPRSLAIWIILNDVLVNGGVADEAVSFGVNPLHYCCAKKFALDYQATELIRKLDALPVSWDPKAKAIEKFWEAEQACALTNQRLRLHEGGSLYDPFLDRAAHYVSVALGSCSAAIQKIATDGAWGKGVTSSAKGKWLTEYHKLSAKPESTRPFRPLAQALWSEITFGLDDREISEVEGSVVAFVPKDARSHRAIAVEPSMNLYAQRAIGKHLKARLRRSWNLDLHSQERNQRLAFEGSLSDDLCTIDLSSASDTVSIGIVERLFPSDWFALLNATRCPFTQVEGQKVMLHKWSSMGNGYTFELETLIFGALVRSVIRPGDWYSGAWSVYGDDIVVPDYAFTKLCELLEYCGFTLNKKKTFSNSPFRESCGADFYDGVNVRPFYLKRIDGVSMMQWANHIFGRSLTRHSRTWHSLCWDLGPSFPRVPSDSKVLGLYSDGILPFSYLSGPIVRKGRVGRLCRVIEWLPQSVSSKSVDGPMAVVAHLRTLLGRADPWEGGLTSETNLPAPWRLTATGSGKWVTKTHFLVEH